MMDQFQASLEQIAMTHVPTVLLALGLLFGGWLVALFVSSLITSGLRRLGVTRLVTQWSSLNLTEASWEKWTSRTIFVLLLLLVLVGFFQVLGLTQVSAPLNSFLDRLFSYAPRLFGPLVLLAAGWAIATVARAAVIRVLFSPRFSEKLKPIFGESEESQKSVAETTGNMLYAFILILFSLAILETLGLQGVLSPIQTMVDTTLAFLPHLAAAVAILFFGSLFAKLVKTLVVNLTAAAGLEALSKRIDLAPVLGKNKASELLGKLVYLLIMIPVVISALNALRLEAITEPSSVMLGEILSSLPNIFAAGLVLLVAFYVGRFTGRLVSDLLTGSGFDRLFFHLGLQDDVEAAAFRPSRVVEYFIFAGILFFASIEAFQLLGFQSVGAILTSFVAFSGDVLLGILVLGLGMFLANLAAKAIRSSAMTFRNGLATAARVTILILSGALALRQIGIAEEMITVLLALVVGAIAIASAIAFGVGGRHVAERLLTNLADNLEGKPSVDTKPLARREADAPV